MRTTSTICFLSGDSSSNNACLLMSHKFISRISYLSMAQTLCLILSVLFVSGHSDDWEKHIRAVTNAQLTGNGKYVWQTVLQSKDTNSIVIAADKMPVATNRRLTTNQLLPLLTDSLQGIAIHSVLCAMWKKQSSGDRGARINFCNRVKQLNRYPSTPVLMEGQIK